LDCRFILKKSSDSLANSPPNRYLLISAVDLQTDSAQSIEGRNGGGLAGVETHVAALHCRRCEGGRRSPKVHSQASKIKRKLPGVGEERCSSPKVFLWPEEALEDMATCGDRRNLSEI